MERKRQIPGPDGNPLPVTEVGFRAGEALRLWASDTDLVQLPPSKSTGEEPLVDGETMPDFSRRGALEKLIGQWAGIAVSHAIVRSIDDPAGLIATVVGIDGAWGFGHSDEEALDELRSVLIGWASLKLEDGDDDIPSMEGVHLVVDR